MEQRKNENWIKDIINNRSKEVNVGNGERKEDRKNTKIQKKSLWRKKERKEKYKHQMLLK